MSQRRRNRKPKKASESVQRPKNFQHANQKEKFSSRVYPVITCAICGEDIQNPLEAITHGNGVTHFFCCLKLFDEESQKLKENQKICYVGQGHFGICEFAKANQSGAFKIIKRFSLETLEERRHLSELLEEKSGEIL